MILPDWFMWLLIIGGFFGLMAFEKWRYKRKHPDMHKNKPKIKEQWKFAKDYANISLKEHDESIELNPYWWEPTWWKIKAILLFPITFPLGCIITLIEKIKGDK